MAELVGSALVDQGLRLLVVSLVDTETHRRQSMESEVEKEACVEVESIFTCHSLLSISPATMGTN
jgi:hypothetical protein